MSLKKKILAGVLVAAIGAGVYGYTQYVAIRPAEVATVAGGSAEAAQVSAGRSLVVYFTYSENIGDTTGLALDAVTAASLHDERLIDEGNILVMADEIVRETGADRYSIVNAEPYSMAFDGMTDRAKAEIQEDRKITLKNPLPDLAQYDVIYLGTPIWWYTLPQPVKGFLREANLAGKTIVPFGIHRGSGFNKNLETIQELAPKATLTKGFTIDARTPNDKTRAEFKDFLASVRN